MDAGVRTLRTWSVATLPEHYHVIEDLPLVATFGPHSKVQCPFHCGTASSNFGSPLLSSP